MPIAATTRQRAARRLKALRILRGWSRETIAAQSGLTVDDIVAIEQAHPSADFEDIARLSQALNVSLGDVLDPAEWALVRVAGIESYSEPVDSDTK